MYENEIDKYRLEYMASLANNPVILFIGRNGKYKKNAIYTVLDDDKKMYSIGLKVMTVNNDTETLPDILCDFNSRIERNLLKKKNKRNGCEYCYGHF